MPRERLSMQKVREVLRLKFERGLSNRSIASSCRMSHSTVREYLRRAREAAVTWESSRNLGDDRLEELLFPPVPLVPGQDRPVPDWAYVFKELRKKGVTLHLLWQEHKEQNPAGHQYSRFCDHYRAFIKGEEISMRQHHVAGEKLFIDYAGQTMPVVDRGTGEIREAQIFVATLGASNYTFVEATWSQSLPDWIASHTRAFRFLGGCPMILVPDNLRSGVKSPHLYEPELNPTYREMAIHYGVAVLPARVARPRDKAKAENAVLVAERWILARLRNHEFFSLHQLNEAISKLLAEYNDRPFQKLPGSRRSLFLELDKPVLQDLPEPYELAVWRKVRAGIDYHVEIDGHYYSVPYKLRRENLEARVTGSTVEVIHKNKRVASHIKGIRKGQHTTVNEHMPESHRQYADWTPQRLIKWAEKNGPDTALVVKGIMDSRNHPQHGFRACLGIMRLGKIHGDERLEAACRRALAINALSYKSIQSILDTGLDARPLPERKNTEKPTVEHPNIRGPKYFAGKETA